MSSPESRSGPESRQGVVRHPTPSPGQSGRSPAARSSEVRSPDAPPRRTASEPREGSSGRYPRANNPERRGNEATCARCGQLNRPEAVVCGKCNAPLRSEVLSKEHHDEAERLLVTGHYKEAAGLFARLADAEADRRLRSILRSKEREARKREQERVDADLTNRASENVRQGNLVGALAMLESGLAQIQKDAATSTAASASEAERLALGLRRQLSRRRQMRMILVLTIVVLVVAGAVCGFMLFGGA